jgi:hypothetical protein
VLAVAASPAHADAPPDAPPDEDPHFVELPEPPDDGTVAFRRWAERVAAQEELRVGALWTVELDGDPTLERAARLCGAQRDVHTLLIEDPDTGRRWKVSESAWDRSPACPDVDTLSWEHADEGLVITDGVAGEHRERWIGLRGERLVEAAYWHARSTPLPSEVEVRWDLQTLRATIAGDGLDARRDIEREGWIVTMGAPDQLELASTWVRSGGVRWRGPEDASLSVGASSTHDDRVRLEVVVHDDQPVVAREGSTLDGVDRLEIWWASPGADLADPFGDERLPRGVVVTPLVDGRVHAQWIGHEPADALPEVAGNFERLRVTFPVPASSIGSFGAAMPLTVVFHDVDGRRGTPPTVIATSRVDPSLPVTFGWLVRHGDGERFPSIGDPLQSVEPASGSSEGT